MVVTGPPDRKSLSRGGRDRRSRGPEGPPTSKSPALMGRAHGPGVSAYAGTFGGLITPGFPATRRSTPVCPT